MEKKSQGICFSCKNVKTCINFCNSENPIWYCEEFECNTASGEDIKQDVPLSESENNTLHNPNKEDTDNYKGLCINCENKETCKLQIPESGVWHCEEYR